VQMGWVNRPRLFVGMTPHGVPHAPCHSPASFHWRRSCTDRTVHVAHLALDRHVELAGDTKSCRPHAAGRKIDRCTCQYIS